MTEINLTKEQIDYIGSWIEEEDSDMTMKEMIEGAIDAWNGGARNG